MEKLETISQRLEYLINRFAKGNQREFAESIEISYSYMAKLSTGNREVSKGILDKLYKKYNVSATWVNTGDGPMLVGEESGVRISAEATPLNLDGELEIEYSFAGTDYVDLGDGKILMTIPFVDQYAYGGYLSGWSDPEFMKELPKHSIIVEKHHSGVYRAFQMRGDSMNDGTLESIKSGSVVTGKNIPRTYWESRFHLHKYVDYVIVHKEGILVKRIIKHDVENGIITCRSLNSNKEEYPDFEIKLEEVYELYNIISVETKRGI